MIATSCPQCGRPLYFEDRHAGAEGQCDGCKALLVIPQPAPQAGYGGGLPTSPGTYSDPRYSYSQTYQPPQTNGLAIAGFVLSLVGFFVCGVVLCPIGIILSAVAMQRQPRGFAIAGLIIGIVGTIGAILLIAFWRDIFPQMSP